MRASPGLRHARVARRPPLAGRDPPWISGYPASSGARTVRTTPRAPRDPGATIRRGVSSGGACRLDGRRSAWRCLGQDAWIIDPKSSVVTSGDLSWRRTLHRWRGIAQQRGVQARCPVDSSSDALKARSRLERSGGRLTDRGHILMADDRKSRGAVVTDTIGRWCGSGCHHEREHGNHEDGREAAH